MGRLKPGATYIYEHVDGITYARESGTTERFEIGRTYERQQKDSNLRRIKFWVEVEEEAKSNPALQKAIENVKIVYYMSQKDAT